MVVVKWGDEWEREAHEKRQYAGVLGHHLHDLLQMQVHALYNYTGTGAVPHLDEGHDLPQHGAALRLVALLDEAPLRLTSKLGPHPQKCIVSLVRTGMQDWVLILAYKASAHAITVSQPPQYICLQGTGASYANRALIKLRGIQAGGMAWKLT